MDTAIKFSVKITKAEKLYIQSDGSTILAVDFDLLKEVDNGEPELVAHYSHGFPLETTKEEILAYFGNYILTYTANAERAATNAAFDAANAVADETISEIGDLEIKN